MTFHDIENGGAKLRWTVIAVIISSVAVASWKASSTLAAVEQNSTQTLQAIQALRDQLKDKNSAQDAAIARNDLANGREDDRLRRIDLTTQHLTDTMQALATQLAALTPPGHGR